MGRLDDVAFVATFSNKLGFLSCTNFMFSFSKLSMSCHVQLFPSFLATHTLVGNGDDHSYKHWAVRVGWLPAYRCGHRPALFSTQVQT